MSTRTVATCNVQKDMPLGPAKAALDTVLTYRPDVLGLQEWGRHRDGILRDLPGYSFARPHKGGGPVILGPVIGLERCYGVTLARRELVGHLPGRKNRLPASIATVVLAADDSGDDIAAVNFHLTAEVQYAGRYRHDPAHWLRVRRHKRERRRLIRLVRRLTRKREVYAVGDSNFDGFTLPPLHTCWDGRKEGTLGGRAVDIVAAERHPDNVRTLATGSDHRAVVVTYKEHR